MASPVFYVPVNDADSIEVRREKMERLLARSGLLEPVSPGSSVAIKIHFGEEGNRGYVKPGLVRRVVDEAKRRGGSPTLADTNTLYRGRRVFSQDHLRLAHEHGFTLEGIGCDIAVPDEHNEPCVRAVACRGKRLHEAKIPAIFLDADVLAGVAHFKGHVLCGIGGALKNIGMGCASREGKLFQHAELAPKIKAGRCTACGACVEACPAGALSIASGRAVLDGKLCIGCAACIAACRYGAVDVPWSSGTGSIQYKMVEYVHAVLSHRGPSVFINVATRITAECDCMAGDDPSVAPDVGFLASTDPVALDQACVDLVFKAAGGDVLREAHPSRDYTQQLRYAEKIGVGSRAYELVACGP